jgi:uncharacterized protein (TIGR00369 family)
LFVPFAPFPTCSLCFDHLDYAVLLFMTFQPSNPNFAAEVKTSFAKQAVMATIGALLTKVEPGICEITLPYKTDLTQQNGFLHAGIVTTIADSACGYAAYSLMPSNSDVLSVEFKVNLMRPAKGSSFIAVAEVLKPGRTLTIVRADVFAIDEHNEQTIVATMLGTMMCLNAKT